MTPAEIKQIRHQLGLTQTQLGQRLGIKLRQVQYLESGQSRPSGSVLVLLRQLSESIK